MADGTVSEGALPTPARRGPQLRMASLLVLLSFFVYNANLRLVSAGDNYPARYLPFGILKHFTLKLDPIADMVAQGETHPHWCVQRGGHTYSQYPIALPVLVTPLYLPAAAYLHWHGWSDPLLEKVARVMEKVTASLIASLSVGLMHLLLVRRTRCRWPLLLTLAYAFGTNTWMIGSQALWQHGLAELLIVLALFLVLGPCSAARALGLGICLALIAAVRPPDALLAAPLGLFALRWSRGKVWLLLTGAAGPIALLLAYNFRVANHVAGGYSTYHGLDAFRYSLSWGVVGLLFSPARGLFAFSPFLLFLPIGLWRLVRDARTRTLALLVLGGVVLQLGLYARLDWRAGCSWGPRWLTDMLPLLVWMLAAGVGSLSRVGIAAFAATATLSAGVQVVGAFWYTGESDALIMRHAGDPNDLPVVWDVSNAPFLVELRHAPAPREMLLEADGFVDRIRADGVAVEQVVAGADLEILGWALTDRRTPAVVRVMATPIGHTPWSRSRQYPIAATDAFGERPDVTRTMKGKGPAGWQVTLKTDGLDPGLHCVEVKALANAGGEYRHVAHRCFEVLPPGPESHARVAVHRLRSRQQSDGFWLTDHTRSAQFDEPTTEMNVFVTAAVVDMLEPAARSAGLEPMLELARRHLEAQIEPNGLVRYHGRGDSPTIPALGRLITPDADDTALAWRIAGRTGDSRQADAVCALQSYRDARGLYRTWLAPRDEYVSIDPGEDPNPTDVGIQMHVLMFFAKFDPDAAKSLHQALGTAIAEDRNWVYYKLAPLVPLWRATDLRSLGYPIKAPERYLQSVVPGQEVWVRACRYIEQSAVKGLQTPASAEVRELLDTLAKNNFSAIRKNPPLLYHNDLTAKCSRYYWSEDFGYALWLRLHFETAARRSQLGASREKS